MVSFFQSVLLHYSPIVFYSANLWIWIKSNVKGYHAYVMKWIKWDGTTHSGAMTKISSIDIGFEYVM